MDSYLLYSNNILNDIVIDSTKNNLSGVKILTVTRLCILYRYSEFAFRILARLLKQPKRLSQFTVVSTPICRDLQELNHDPITSDHINTRLTGKMETRVIYEFQQQCSYRQPFADVETMVFCGLLWITLQTVT